MNPLPPDWPQSAAALLEQAKQGGDLVKLIMAGTQHIESWLIENRILPLLQPYEPALLRFTISGQLREQRSASLLPLPDGSAFACSTDGLWSALEAADALHEIEHIGSRFAPGDHWLHGFAASVQWAGATAAEIRPMEVAGVWEKITGSKPGGFETSRLDQVEAYSFGVIDKMLHVKNRLGL